MTLQLDDYRLLGRSGLRVSPLSLGAMTFGMTADWGSTAEDARKMFNHYVEHGGNFIDTANFYASGDSERELGKLMAGRREQLVMASKYSLTMRTGDPNASGNHRKNMMRSVEDSLKRLGTDYLDLFYLHIWDGRTPVEEILRAFDDLVQAGKILYVGISDTPAWQISRMQAIADLRGWSPLVALQIPYNLADRTVEREFMPMAQEMGLGILPWSPLAGGVLSGKYTREDLTAARQPITASTDRKNINLASGRLSERSLEIAVTLADEMGKSAAQVALAWTLQHPAVTSPIIGARTFAQFEDNLGALEVVFDEEHLQRLDEISKLELCFPYTLIDTPTSAAMFGNVKVASRP